MDKWDEADLIYLAGFLDGEGCFTVSGYTCLIQVSNTYLPVLEWLLKFGGFLSKPKKKVRTHHKTLRQWRIAGQPAIDLCLCLIPFLKEKQKQAELLIAIQETRDPIKHTHGLPDKIKNIRDELMIELKECKGKDYV